MTPKVTITVAAGNGTTLITAWRETVDDTGTLIDQIGTLSFTGELRPEDVTFAQPITAQERRLIRAGIIPGTGAQR